MKTIRAFGWYISVARARPSFIQKFKRMPVTDNRGIVQPNMRAYVGRLGQLFICFGQYRKEAL